MEEIVKLTNVSKSYNLGNKCIQVLAEINLTLNKGEFLMIVGPSGSGKSTLLNIVGTLDSPSSGNIELFENLTPNTMTEAERADIRLNKIGFVYQAFHLIPFLNALDNVGVILRLAGYEKKEIIYRATDLLSRVGLNNRLRNKPHELSFGERQRVAIARSLINNPSLVLADEPTGNLDSQNSTQIIRLMRELCSEKGVAFIVVTHDNNILWAADRVIKMSDGNINQLTNTQERDFTI